MSTQNSSALPRYNRREYPREDFSVVTVNYSGTNCTERLNNLCESGHLSRRIHWRLYKNLTLVIGQLSYRHNGKNIIAASKTKFVKRSDPSCYSEIMSRELLTEIGLIDPKPINIEGVIEKETKTIQNSINDLLRGMKETETEPKEEATPDCTDEESSAEESNTTSHSPETKGIKIATRPQSGMNKEDTIEMQPGDVFKLAAGQLFSGMMNTTEVQDVINTLNRVSTTEIYEEE